MATLDDFRIERNVYLVLWSVGFLAAAVQLRADWARWSMKRSLNLYHVRQHVLQVLCAAIGILESTDSHFALGVFSEKWQVNFVTAVTGSLVISTMQISCYLLLKSHFAVIQEQPGWLKPVFLSTGIVFAILHVGLATPAGQFGASALAKADLTVTTVWCVLQIVLIDAGFLRIRSVVMRSDKASATENKLYPQYLKIGRVVLLLNIAVLTLVVLMVYSFILASISTTAEVSPFSWKGLLKVVALYVTLWWTLHPPCPRPAGASSAHSTKGTSGSRQSYQGVTSGSPKLPSRALSNSTSARPLQSDSAPSPEPQPAPQAAAADVPSSAAKPSSGSHSPSSSESSETPSTGKPSGSHSPSSSAAPAAGSPGPAAPGSDSTSHTNNCGSAPSVGSEPFGSHSSSETEMAAPSLPSTSDAPACEHVIEIAA